MLHQVALAKCSSYKRGELLSSLREALDLLGGISAFVSPGQKVLLKVNMLGAYHPDKAATTHPEFLAAVTQLVKEAGGHPLVGDSPGFANPQKAAIACGYLRVCREENILFVSFNDSVEVKNPKGERFKSFCIAKAVLDADVIINLPKLKTHNLTGITCAVKNMFGCVPGLLKSEYHVKMPTRKEFSLMLLDLLGVVKPTLNIVDAVVGMEGENGPAAGDPKQIGLIAASADAVAVDRVMCQVVGIENTEQSQSIEVLGARVENVKVADFKKIKLLPEIVFPGPPIFWRIATNLLVEKPVVERVKCTACKNCARVCRSKAISCPRKYPEFDYSKCIRCFCCAEMCPEHAIFIKRNPITGFIFSAYPKLQQLKNRLFLKS